MDKTNWTKQIGQNEFDNMNWTTAKVGIRQRTFGFGQNELDDIN